MKSVSRKLAALCLFVSMVPFVRAIDSPGGPPTMENFSAPSLWGTDYSKGLERAVAEKKTVLLNFTGSDWCIWCHRLHDEVFARNPFIDYAQSHLVLVEVDFPRTKAQSTDVKRQNDDLAQKFGVTGYPTVILVDGHGHELGRTGYMQGGPKTFVRELKLFLAKAGQSSRP